MLLHSLAIRGTDLKITPTVEEIEALRPSLDDRPVTIVNLLKLKPGADGRAAYRRYMDACAPASDPTVAIVHAGPAILDVGCGETWDYVIIARYQAFADFARTVTHPAYQGPAAEHRVEALERTTMLITTTGSLVADFPAD